MMSTKLRVILDTPEHHETSGMPKAVRHLWYNNSSLANMIAHNGCPNTGGQHKLHVEGEAHEVIAWLDLFVEAYPATMPEIMMVKKEIRAKRMDAMGSEGNGTIVVNLNKIQRMFSENGEVVSKPWFWTPEEKATV